MQPILGAGLLDFVNFFEAAGVSASGKRGAQPELHDLGGAAFIEDARTEGKDVEIVVLARHLGLVLTADIGGADAGDFVGADGHADAGAADEDAALGASGGDVFGHFHGKVGIIHRVGGVGSFVDDLMAEREDVLADVVLEEIAGVVGADERFSFRYCIPFWMLGMRGRYRSKGENHVKGKGNYPAEAGSHLCGFSP